MNERVKYYFEEISKIPRASGNMDKISEYIVSFSEKNSLKYIKDEYCNVVVYKNASSGYENSKTIILQAHLDMVAEKDINSEHDFSKDPIELIYEGDFIRANNTTLGADNGVAVAMFLAILEDKQINHPSLEVVFTIDEETGMDGAKNLNPSYLSGEYLLNLDSEEEGVLCVGCAGGATIKLKKDIKKKTYKTKGELFEITIQGLKGGHSGIDIHLNKANANVLMARLLEILLEDSSIELKTFIGGTKDNVITPFSKACLIIKEDILDLEKRIENFEKCIKNEYHITDPNIRILTNRNKETVSEIAIEKETLKKIIQAINILPYGVLYMSQDIKDLVETSANIGVVSIDSNEVYIKTSIRSSVKSRKDLIVKKIKSIAELAELEFEKKSEYPEWEYKKDSFLREKATDIYNEKFGKKPVIEVVHAGLECGFFSNKIKDIDIVSFGPNTYDIHTTKEKVSMSSIDKTYEYLLDILSELK